ncbi:hypothetical protein AYW79_13640 [Ferroacidibacillus organovorans]|uniref:Big-1 domain-containing protein n=1 Tax=Ferroacidibacillus organovorans TaxID=1765683 RepID=A0A162S803_9BACL|nr:hypothetical protein AYJ22_14060 [Ferroacidibacillus organovorans]OAG91659.1 hypothetical protein AYW79_13640 [Ferroacidibacillus organovorans]OPG17579.1 hypothetical protein B2M26_00010 [Ferroacidibacillus organovorans]
MNSATEVPKTIGILGTELYAPTLGLLYVHGRPTQVEVVVKDAAGNPVPSGTRVTISTNNPKIAALGSSRSVVRTLYLKATSEKVTTTYPATVFPSSFAL